jgi:hypothetical protein
VSGGYDFFAVVAGVSSLFRSFRCSLNNFLRQGAQILIYVRIYVSDGEIAMKS